MRVCASDMCSDEDSAQSDGSFRMLLCGSILTCIIAGQGRQAE